MELSFVHPGFAWLLLAIPLIWFLPARPKSVFHGALRTLVLLLGVLALMQPVLVSSRASEHHAVIADLSASLQDNSRQAVITAANELIDAFDDTGTVTLVQIGSGTSLTENTIRLRDESASPLGDALELAAQSIPRGMSGSVTLISDGLATDRHWGSVVEQLVSRGIPVHTLDLATAPSDPFLSAVRSSPVRVGESVTVLVDVIGSGDGWQVKLHSGDRLLASSGPFSSRDRHTVELEFMARQPGFIDISAELEAPGDTDSGNNTANNIVVVQEPVRLLYLGEQQAGAAEQLSALLGPGVDIETAAADLSADTDFQRYDLVMLDDMPARSFPEPAQQALADAVKNAGVGLLHSGGEAAFGDGGYFGTPVAELFPVETPGDEDKIDPSVGLAIILDTSGSMAGTRIELAKHLARVAVRRMQPHDRIGIVEFYGNKHWAIPMQPASNKIEIDRAIGRMKAIGGTVLYPAIQEAYYGLLNVNTRYKHILLITDAGVEDNEYEAMARRIAKDNINLSTILVGAGGHNQIMSDIANWGQGRFYSVGNQFQLVELILKQPSTKKPPKYKRGSFAVRGLGGPGWWDEVDRDSLPPLDGYVETELRDGAEVLIEEQQKKHPILATWHYGLGRVTTLMTTPVGSGTEGWSGWDGYGELLGRVIARTAGDNMPFDLSTSRRHGVVTLTAQSNQRGQALAPRAQLLDPLTGQPSDSPVAFKQYAPGWFEADIEAGAGDAVKLLVETGDGARRQRIADAAGSDSRGEKQVDPYLGLDLAALAERTGGTRLAVGNLDSSPLQVSSGELSFIVTEIWPWLLLAALLLYLGELIYRRWPSERARGI